MRELDKVHKDLNEVTKRKLKINPGLESVERLSEFKDMIGKFHDAFADQITRLLKSDMFKEIDDAIHPIEKASAPKPDRIHTESDDLEIYDAVLNNIQSLDKNNFSDAFADFLILIFNHGGQDFLNKHNIPATFHLKNDNIISGIKSSSAKSIKGVDETTIKWVADQISKGRQNGLSNSDIADKIREKVPETYANRAEKIVRTETSNMVGESEHATAKNNGASHKEWVTVGDGDVCPICDDNEAAGTIGIDQSFPSGDLREPAHPYCRCLVEYVFTPFMGTVWHGQ